MKEKSLQKFTDLKEKFDYLLALKKIEPATYYEILNEQERVEFGHYATKMLNVLKDEDRDRFWESLEPITAQDTHNQYWEHNHNTITWAISTLIQECGRMPTKTEIAKKTGLSRQTIYKHLKEYANHPQHLGQLEQFRFLTTKVLAKVFHYAVNGDISAAKLYFNVLGYINKEQNHHYTSIQNHSNYIQINGMIVSQETVGCLPPEQLSFLESVLKPVIEKGGKLVKDINANELDTPS